MACFLYVPCDKEPFIRNMNFSKIFRKALDRLGETVVRICWSDWREYGYPRVEVFEHFSSSSD